MNDQDFKALCAKLRALYPDGDRDLHTEALEELIDYTLDLRHKHARLVRTQHTSPATNDRLLEGARRLQGL